MTLQVETHADKQQKALCVLLRYSGGGPEENINGTIFYHRTCAFTLPNEDTTTIKLQIFWDAEGGRVVTPCVPVRVYKSTNTRVAPDPEKGQFSRRETDI